MRTATLSKLFILFTIIILASTLSSCKTRSEADKASKEAIVVTEEPDTPVEPVEPVNPAELTVSDSIDCRLMVNFISTGGGINGKARLELERYQMKFADAENLPVQPRRIPKGREGEIEYCYPMYGYDEAQTTRFIEGLREVMKDQPLVIISEHRKQALR